MSRKYYVYPEEQDVSEQMLCPVEHVIYYQCSPGYTEETGRKLWEQTKVVLRQTHTALVVLSVEDWNGDLSPWQAPRVMKRGEDFAGKGEVYLDQLCNVIIPEIEERYHMSPKRRGLGGYSLAGLFAVYAMMEKDLFTDILSVSGSFWFDGFVEYMQAREISPKVKQVYLSLGQREPKTGNVRMAAVGERTLAVKNYLEQRNIPVHFQWNPGNHFQEEAERMAKSIEYICEHF